MRTAFLTELLAIAEARDDVWLVTGDLGYSVLEPFAQRFPDRYINAGVAEQNMVGVAAGLAHSGATVVVYSIANFPTFRCLEQVRNDVCYAHASVVIVSVGSGFSYGSHGYTHHAIEDLAVMRAMPGMTVVSPGDPSEARQATRALVELGVPAYLRLGKAGERSVVSNVDDAFTIGQLRCVRRGTDVTIVATGSVLPLACDAADRLASGGVSTRVFSGHTIKPFDTDSLAIALGDTAGVITVEEHRIVGGLRSVVAESLLGLDRDLGKVTSIGVDPDAVFGTGDQDHLRRANGLDVEHVVTAAHDLLRRSSARR